MLPQVYPLTSDEFRAYALKMMEAAAAVEAFTKLLEGDPHKVIEEEG